MNQIKAHHYPIVTASVPKDARQPMRFMDCFVLLAMTCVMFVFLTNMAQAACTSPDGTEGLQVYDSTAKIMKYCDGDNWISMKGANTVAVTGAKISTGSVASGGFPTNWAYATGTDSAAVYDGVTTTASGDAFTNEVCAIRFGFSAQVSSIILHADDGGGGIDVRRGYSTDGVNWTVIDSGSAYSATVGVSIPMNNIVAKYVGVSTTDASATCDEISIVATQAGGGSAGMVQDDDSDTQIQVEESADDDTIRFDTDGNERMVIIDTGEVGIGTDAPASLLDVAGGVRIGDDAGVCTAAKEGTLRFSSSMIQLCTQNVWVDVSLVTGGDDGYAQEPPVTNEEGWPDVIRCTNGSDTRYFWFQYRDINDTWMQYQEKNNGYYIYFNFDQTYRNMNYGSSDCAYKSIADLVTDGQTFDFDSGVATTMVSGWPDVIRCFYSSYERYMFLSYENSSIRRYEARDGHHQDFNIADGTYNTQSLSTSCTSQSIADLTASSDIFNFVGGDGTQSMLQDVPDAIVCEDNNSDQHMLHLMYEYDTYYHYSTNYNNIYYEFWKAGGTQKADSFNSNCHDKTLAELKADGLTLNFADNGVVNSIPSDDDFMVEGWPDIILCENGATNYALRIGHVSSNIRYYYSYRQEYYMTFNATTGAYNSQHSAIAGTPCSGQSISDIITGAPGMSAIAYKTSGASTTITSGWPDAIRCNYAGSSDYYYLYSHSDGTEVHYYRWYHGSTTHKHSFNRSTTNWSSNYQTTDCSGMSISQLQTAGKTFDMIAGDDTGSMLSGWPDAIRCRDDGYDYIYWLNHNTFGNEVYYLNTSGYYYQYEPERKMYETDNNNSECTYKSIAQIIADGDAFYFVDTGNAGELEDGYTSGGASMVPGWPDALVCNSQTNGEPYVYWLEYVGTSTTRYKRRGQYNSQQYVDFGLNGHYNSESGTNTDCIYKSIEELRNYGQTFDLVSGSSGAGASIMDDNDGDTRIQMEASPDEDHIRLTTASVERMVIDDTGKIGMNTGSNTLYAQLEVNGAIKIGDDTSTCDVNMDGAIRYNSSTLQVCVNGTGWGSVGLGKFGDGTNTNDAVYTDGNVGIGTTTPSELLEVAGTIKTASVIFTPVAGAAPVTGAGAVAATGGVQSMTTAQRDAIATPWNGMLIFNTSTQRLELFNGVLWVALTGTTPSAVGAGGHIYTSCSDILAQVPDATDGTYAIDPDGTGTAVGTVSVYCDMTTDGGGWTLIARNNATTTFTNFNKSWAEYKAGFGDVSVNTSLGWIGNEAIYYLSAGGVELDVQTDIQRHEYQSFSIANEAGMYALTVASTANSNDADGFQTHHSGYNFSTHDDDNDIAGSNCASSYASGWWYKDCYRMSFAGNNNSHVYWRDNVGAAQYVNWIEMWVR